VKNSPKMSSLKLKKRWFVLTHNSLDYYKSSEKNALKLGTLVLNSLCSVVPPDEKIFKETGTDDPGLKHSQAQSERVTNEVTRGQACSTKGIRRCILASSTPKEILFFDLPPKDGYAWF